MNEWIIPKFFRKNTDEDLFIKSIDKNDIKTFESLLDKGIYVDNAFIKAIKKGKYDMSSNLC